MVSLRQKIETRQAKVGIIGLGYVGLPLAVEFARAGFDVTGDAVDICVPTPLRKTKGPDMSYVVSAEEQIAKYIHPGMLIVLESTTYPGTTAEVLQPMFEDKGLTVG